MYRLIDDIPVFGEPLDNAVEQIRTCREDAWHAALMADHHQGYAVPIGGVVAYENHVSPSGVGFDIACGNKAVLLDANSAEVQKNIRVIMDDIYRTLSFGIGMKNEERVEHELFEDDEAWAIPAASKLRETARQQLGTIGSGNHYVDVFIDEQERVWVGVHFGSRGLGHRLATHYIKAGGGKDGINVKPVLLESDSELGREYIACMNLAGRYAYAGRDWVCEKVASIIGAEILDEVHNHHNFAWRENHAGRDVWVVRKGATPAFPGQRSFIGGSMGDNSVIVQGRPAEENAATLCSTVHGAGRVMSRTQAAGRRAKWGKPRQGGAITPDMMMAWVNRAGVELRGGGTDESPHCYKRLHDVLAWHSDSIEVLHTLRPIGVAMAGENEYDPFKD